ncbi:pyridoxal-phosphate-dependent aminotransferase family protein [Tenacibaculum maritimum]|uniref:pyridoxal-phosphate-dependent aminotransferase family protein n=1 Tax=Tenacibaculum maritimum TaxID=107401 RepID=UPI0012E52A6B|nr:alanine--glyoxylate aminotransferase family protein [Tenacibaculum maritimum]CAA0148629.1 Aminotransferase, class V family protein [Tenacibaculum maritimum]CAA0155178.1 Aminotransferase, class V family protein [Tenacibaculum maritimum]
MKNRKLLMIPGPIEFEPSVLRAMGEVTTSHVAPNFIETFGNCLDIMQELWKAPNGQPFIITGSGTLAMDMAISNLIEYGDNALVLSTGYFGNRFKDILTTYGANVTMLSASIGKTVPLEDIEKALKQKKYKLLTMTHVDTSTGVLINPKPIADLAKKYNALTVLDGVCSVAGEKIEQEEWGIDVVLTGSQKAIGVPPGLALLVASPKAMTTWKNRNTPVQSYYSNWKYWLPIMQAYQHRTPSYFGTPSVNLIRALEVSLTSIKKQHIDTRTAIHKKYATAFRKAIEAIDLKILPFSNEIAANTLTAIYYPTGIDGNEFRKKVSELGVIIAGGLHPEIKSTYFRVGHMGAINTADIIATLSAIEYGLSKEGHSFTLGNSLAAFQQALSS